MTTINEISNPDESYMGTLNLQFLDYPIDDDEDMIQQYESVYNALEKYETDHRETELFNELYVSDLLNQINK